MSILDSDALYAEVVQRLRLAAQDDRTYDAAQMHLINLPEVIASAGADWPALKDRIRLGSMTFLCACLAPSDLVIPAGDGFLIIFADGQHEALRIRAEELRLLLLEFYVGQEGMRALGVNAAPRQVESRELRAMLAPPPPPDLDIEAHACVFAPIWSARAQLIATYLCTPMRDTPAGPRPGYDARFAETGENAHRDYCSLDLALLDSAQAALEAPTQSDVRPILIASVHSTTMQNRRARAAYLERLAAIPAEHLRHVAVRVTEVEAGTPIINLADWAGLLRARAPHVMLEFHPSARTVPNLASVGVWAAGFQAGDPTCDLARQIGRWGEAMARQRIKFYLGNLATMAQVRAAAAAGAEFIGSATIWPPAARPAGVISAPAPFTSRANTVSFAPT